MKRFKKTREGAQDEARRSFGSTHLITVKM